MASPSPASTSRPSPTSIGACRRLRATGQTLFNAAVPGLGAVVGTNVCGALYDHLHANGMYLVAAGICAVAVSGLVLLLPEVGAPLVNKGRR